MLNFRLLFFNSSGTVLQVIMNEKATATRTFVIFGMVLRRKWIICLAWLFSGRYSRLKNLTRLIEQRAM
jgi:hypothetical protein